MPRRLLTDGGTPTWENLGAMGGIVVAFGVCLRWILGVQNAKTDKILEHVASMAMANKAIAERVAEGTNDIRAQNELLRNLVEQIREMSHEHVTRMAVIEDLRRLVVELRGLVVEMRGPSK